MHRPDATVNYEGELAFKLNPLTDLYIRAVSCLVGEPKFYESREQSNTELIRSIHNAIEIDPEYVLKLAVYLREEMYLRTVPLMILTEFANSKAVGTVPHARNYVERCIQRADESSEMFAYQLSRNRYKPRIKAKIPMMIKFGVGKALNNFSEYELSKYNRQKGRSVKLRDVLFLTHPKATSAQQQNIFDNLADDTLEIADTWEYARSSGLMTWHDVINNIFHKNGRVNNYMAIMRNLRNCLQDKSVTKEDIMLLCSMISDRNAVLHSKQFPFRYFSAYRELQKYDWRLSVNGIQYVNDILEALDTAVSYSADNYPKLSGSSTMIAADFSGSMDDSISGMSSVKRYEVAAVLGMIANRFCGHTLFGIFGDKWKVVPIPKTDGVLSNTLKARNLVRSVGLSTNGHLAIQYLLDNGIEVDRIMIFTDCQLWNSGDDTHFAPLFLRYQKKHPKVKLYIFDLSGYGTIMIPQNTRNVCVIGGFSDKIFYFIKTFEESGDINTIVNHIKSINVLDR